MTQELHCQWCGQAALPDKTLCASCLWAKEESGKLEKAAAPENRKTSRQIVTFYMVQFGKALVAGVLSLIALGAALAGTCGLLVGTLGGGVGFLPFALIAFGVLALVIWLIMLMYKTDLIGPANKKRVPSIMPVKDAGSLPPPLPPPSMSTQETHPDKPAPEKQEKQDNDQTETDHPAQDL